MRDFFIRKFSLLIELGVRTEKGKVGCWPVWEGGWVKVKHLGPRNLRHALNISTQIESTPSAFLGD